MTRVLIEQEGRRWTITAEGHATGSPECCAALSTLFAAAGGYLQNLEREEDVVVYDYQSEKGLFRLEVEAGERLEAALDMLTIGLLQLAEANEGALSVDVEKYF